MEPVTKMQFGNEGGLVCIYIEHDQLNSEGRRVKTARSGSFNHRQSSVAKGSWRPGSRSYHKQSRLGRRVLRGNPMLLARWKAKYED